MPHEAGGIITRMANHPSHFLNLTPSPIMKPLKKRNHLQSLIPSEKVWLSSFTFPAEIIWGSVVHKMLWNPWISKTRNTISKHSNKKIEV